ncbi:MAG: hypothetical protein FJ023_09295 [Chloroflexi bacterium]|nr:hypothetical protein [Chloroflexota bacterium]
MLNKFLVGKKKYSVFITTAIIALLDIFGVRPDMQNELMEFIPMVAMVLSGIIYLIMEGTRDIQREKTNTAAVQAQAGVVMANGVNIPRNIAVAQPAQSQPEIQPIDQLSPEPFDVKTFHERVLNDTDLRYTEVNPATLYYMAKDKGRVTTCTDIKQAQDYWDYLVTLAYEANAYVNELSKPKPGECRRPGPEYYASQLDLAKTIRFRDSVHRLADSGIDWKARVANNDSLINVGALAEEVLKYGQ